MFVQARVLYIVGDNVGNAAKIDQDLMAAGVKNRFFINNPGLSSNREYINFLKKLPPECVFSIKKKSATNNNTTVEFIIAIPFISSHLGLPVKVGETIWLQEVKLTTDNSNFYNITGFYLGRAHSYFTTEDVSYCYDAREENIFKANRKSFAESIPAEKNARDKLKNKNQKAIRQNAIYQHEFNISSEEAKFVKDSDKYFQNKIENYSLKPIGTFIKKPEDVAVRGTYNTLVNLTSETDKNSSDFRYGSVELVAGYGEYSKKNVEYIPLTIQNKNNNVSSEKTQLLKYESDLAGIQIHNGIHYETIKSDMSFVNEGTIPYLKLNKYQNNYLGNSYKYDRDAASFAVSEYNLKNIEINKRNRLSLRDIQSSTFTINSQNNIINSNKFITHTVPNKYPDIETDGLLDLYAGKSSLTGVADSIVFCTHKSQGAGNEEYNNIKLIQSNSDDKLSSQISLNSSGNILIDGHKILIGAYSRLEKKKNGKSALVYLGNSDTSQSLVLGEQLNQFLEEMLNIQISVFVLLKDIIGKLNNSDQKNQKIVDDTLNALNTFANSGASLPPPIGGIFLPLITNLVNPILDSGFLKDQNDSNNTFIKEKLLTNKNEDSTEVYISRIENIISNLDKQLSKFTKTS